MTTIAEATSSPSVACASRAFAPLEIDGVVWDARPSFESGLRSLGDWHRDPAAAGFEAVKRGQGREVWRGALGGVSVYIKVLRLGGWFGVGQRLLRRTPGAAEWRGLRRLAAADVATPAPLAFARSRGRGGEPVEMLVTEAVERGYELDAFWRGVMSDSEQARRRRQATELVEAVAALVARSHQAGIAHPDLHPQNILVRVDGPGAYTPLMVDVRLDGAPTAVDADGVVRNLTQLNQWFQRYASVADRWRFLKAYVRNHQQLEDAYETAIPLSLSIDALWRETRRRGPAYAERLARKRDARLRGVNAYFTTLRLADGAVGQACLQMKRPLAGSALAQGALPRAFWEGALAEALIAGGAGAALRVAPPTRRDDGSTVNLFAFCPTDRPSGWARAAFRYAHQLAHRHAPVAPPLAWGRRGSAEWLVFESPTGWRLHPVDAALPDELSAFSRPFDARGGLGRSRRAIARLTRENEELWVLG